MTRMDSYIENQDWLFIDNLRVIVIWEAEDLLHKGIVGGLYRRAERRSRLYADLVSIDELIFVSIDELMIVIQVELKSCL